jgi:hypothetical protein
MGDRTDGRRWHEEARACSAAACREGDAARASGSRAREGRWTEVVDFVRENRATAWWVPNPSIASGVIPAGVVSKCAEATKLSHSDDQTPTRLGRSRDIFNRAPLNFDPPLGVAHSDIGDIKNPQKKAAKQFKINLFRHYRPLFARPPHTTSHVSYFSAGKPNHADLF